MARLVLPRLRCVICDESELPFFAGAELSPVGRQWFCKNCLQRWVICEICGDVISDDDLNHLFPSDVDRNHTHPSGKFFIPINQDECSNKRIRRVDFERILRNASLPQPSTCGRCWSLFLEGMEKKQEFFAELSKRTLRNLPERRPRRTGGHHAFDTVTIQDSYDPEDYEYADKSAREEIGNSAKCSSCGVNPLDIFQVARIAYSSPTLSDYLTNLGKAANANPCGDPCQLGGADAVERMIEYSVSDSDVQGALREMQTPSSDNTAQSGRPSMLQRLKRWLWGFKSRES